MLKQVEKVPAAILLTSKEAALALAISPRKLWALTQTGRIPCVRLDRSVRYRPESLGEYVASLEVPRRK